MEILLPLNEKLLIEQFDSQLKAIEFLKQKVVSLEFRCEMLGQQNEYLVKENEDLENRNQELKETINEMGKDY